MVKANRPDQQFPASPEVSIATGAAFDQLLGQFAEATRSLPSAGIPAPSAEGSRDTGTDHAADFDFADNDKVATVARDTADDNATFERPETPNDDGATGQPSSTGDNQADASDDRPANTGAVSGDENNPANDDHPEGEGKGDTGLDRAAAETEDLPAADAIADAAESQPQASAMAASVAAEQSQVASAGANPASTAGAGTTNGTEAASTAPTPQATPNMAANAAAGAVTPQTLPDAANNPTAQGGTTPATPTLPDAANTQGTNNTSPQTNPNTATASAAVAAAPHADAAQKGVTTALGNLTTSTGSGTSTGDTNTATDGKGETPAPSQSRANINITVTQGTGQPQAQGNSLLAPGTAIAGLMQSDDGAPETVLATVKSNTAAGTNAQAGSAVANGTTPTSGTTDGANTQANTQANTTANNSAFGLAQGAVASNGAASTNGTQNRLSLDTPIPSLLGGTANAPQTGNSTTAQAMSAATRPTPVAQPLVDQVAVQITKAAAQGLDKISIKLSPASLGRIDVQLELTHDGRVAAVVTAERSETLDLLQRDARGLERALLEAGLKTDSNSLNFSLRGNGQDGDDPSDHDGAPGLDVAEDAANEDNANVPTLAQISGYANTRANIGGIDIQV